MLLNGHQLYYLYPLKADLNSNARLYICFTSYCTVLKREMSSAIFSLNPTSMFNVLKLCYKHCFLLFHLLPFSLHFLLLSITVYASPFVCLACNVFLQISVLPPLESACSHLSFSTRKSALSLAPHPFFFLFNTLLRLSFSSLCYMSLLG